MFAAVCYLDRLGLGVRKSAKTGAGEQTGYQMRRPRGRESTRSPVWPMRSCICYCQSDEGMHAANEQTSTGRDREQAGLLRHYGAEGGIELESGHLAPLAARCLAA